MKRFPKRKLEEHAEQMLVAGLKNLEDLHSAHAHNPITQVLNANVPGIDITVGQLVHNAFKIVEPLIEIARKKYPAFFKFIDWAANIVKQLLSKH